MSAEPRPSDNLSQLKELMMGDEKRELSELRERLNELDAESVDRLAKDLATALYRRREMGDESFDELVAALQSGTESAIQRSVTQDKSKLSKALFPIMGPAIRNYVVDLFRGMVEELNETIRNTTSMVRIKWRIQAKLAGKSYSEFVILKTRSFYTEEVYLIQRETGLLLLHASRNPDEEANGEADLVSGMFTAIRSFVKDSFARDEPSGDDTAELDGFTFGEREVLIEVGPTMVIAAVAHGVPPASAKDTLKSVLEDLHAELGDRLGNFSGDMAQLEIGRPTLRRALMESKATEDDGKNGGGFWRAWIALGTVVAVVAVISFFGMREQGKFDQFVDALRREPGVAVTEVENDGWWRKRTLRGLRDPLAVDPAALAVEWGIDKDQVTFFFDFMFSLEPMFAEPREAKIKEEQQKFLNYLEKLRDDLGTATKVAAEDLDSTSRKLEETRLKTEESIASLRAAGEASAKSEWKMLETLVRSYFSEIDELLIEFDAENKTASFSGDLEAGDLFAVTQRVNTLKSLMAIDISGLSDDGTARLKQMLSAIKEVRIAYQSGTLDAEDGQRIDELVELTKKLDEYSASLNHSYDFEVLAHPLIGPGRTANRKIEMGRAEQVRERLIAAGINEERIGSRVSEDFSKAGGGVSLEPIESSANKEPEQ